MGRDQLLNSIAQAGYNIGFGAKKHFVTYDLYRIMPKLTSFMILAIGVLQLTTYYKKFCYGDIPDVIGALLIIIGFISFVVDITGKNNERFNDAGKILIAKFNRLRNMYNEVMSLDENKTEKMREVFEELERIEQEARSISISEQAIGTHILTNVLFFSSMQVGWIEKELKLGVKDKFPFFHLESFVLYLLLFLILYFILNRFGILPR